MVGKNYWLHLECRMCGHRVARKIANGKLKVASVIGLLEWMDGHTKGHAPDAGVPSYHAKKRVYAKGELPK